MIPNLLIMTEFSEKLLSYLLNTLQKGFCKYYFIDDGTYFMFKRHILKKYHDASYIFCTYGLKKRGMDPDAGMVNAGLAFLSQLIEKSQRIVIL